MLSAFPYLLSFERLGPTLIRLSLGAVFAFWAYRAVKEKSANNQSKALGILEGIAGLMLIAGFLTQIAALFAAIDLVVRLVGRARNRALLTDGVNYYLILLVMAISLLVTGAGFFAFDLPL
ncbi:MAG: hypothetical protein KGI66_00005 [Patescibacteria group bacterium]|nr:hypothetical protein [Patescibacteria group bacterium]